MKIIKDKNIKWWVGVGSCFMLFAIIAIFAYEKMCFIIKGVEIIADIKQNNNSSLVEIIGNAKNAIHLTLNGREIFIDREGDFKEAVSLPFGLNIITLNAEDKFGNLSEKKFQFVYKEGAEAIAFQNKK